MRNTSLFLRKIYLRRVLISKTQKIRNKSKTCGSEKTEVEIRKALHAK